MTEHITTATIEADLVALNPQARLVDPLPHQCSPTECPAATDGRWLYLGPQDLTRAGSRRLVEPVGAAIDELVG